MNLEIEIQEGIYDDLSVLLSKSSTAEKASAFIAHFFQKKVSEGVVDMYDYTINDLGANGFSANVEYCFAWNITNTCSALVYPKRGPITAFDHAMSII